MFLGILKVPPLDQLRDLAQELGISMSRLSASRSNSRPASEDWLPPATWTVSFLHSTAGRSKGSGVSSEHGGCGVAQIREALHLDTDLLRDPRHLHHSRQQRAGSGLGVTLPRELAHHPA